MQIHDFLRKSNLSLSNTQGKYLENNQEYIRNIQGRYAGIYGNIKGISLYIYDVK